MTTAAHTTPRALTTYLRRATWGLPRARRQELWDELEEHVLTRADHLILTGLTPTQATAQAIHELGPPARVTLGMAKVYTMPNLILAAGTLALALSAGLYALAGGHAGAALNIPVFQQPTIGLLCAAEDPNLPQLSLPVASRGAGRICYRLSSNRDLTAKPAMISVESASRVMGLVGGTVTTRPDGRIQLSRPNGTYMRTEFSLSEGSQRYILAGALFEALISTRDRTDVIRVSGFSQPALSINGQQVRLTGTSGDSVGNNVYSGLVGDAVTAVMYRSSDQGFSFTQTQAASSTPLHRIQTGLKAGEVVTVISRAAEHEFTTDFAVVQQDGSVSLHANASQLQFVSRGTDLVSSVGDRIPAILVRLSNVPLSDLKSGVFVPARATSDAR